MDKDPKGMPIVAGELIVTYKEQVSTQAAGAESEKRETKRKVDVETGIDLSEINAESVSFPEVKNESSQEARQEALERKKQDLERDSSVKAVEYNYVSKLTAVTDDPLVDQQWGLPQIRGSQAWSTSKGAGAIIAVIDSGIHNTHPDIGKIAHEWDFFSNDADAQEDMGHATHVAGIAAAMTNNATGIAGVAPDASLFDYKSCGGVLCLRDATITAIIQATDNGADVINLSQGSKVASLAEEAAVNRAWDAGVVVVASAGNDARNGNPPTYPAAYQNALAVGSIDKAYVRS